MGPIVKIVWTNTEPDKLHVPAEMGTPQPHHLQSTPLDNLCELAGRTCYESYSQPKSRNSRDYHAHLIEVNHGSVWEHGVLNFEFGFQGEGVLDLAWQLLANRPGVLVLTGWDQDDNPTLRITANLRALREWQRWTRPIWGKVPEEATILKWGLHTAAAQKAPLVMAGLGNSNCLPESWMCGITPVAPVMLEEKTVSIFFSNVSRGLSHELVRHRGAISQRSSRFCSESESAWVPHPEMRDDPSLMEAFTDAQQQCRSVYDRIVDSVESRLANLGSDRLTARKQARGAARGVLGNALATELIFSTNLRMWAWMVKQRASPAADAEIREAFVQVKELLLAKFPEEFPKALAQAETE